MSEIQYILVSTKCENRGLLYNECLEIVSFPNGAMHFMSCLHEKRHSNDMTAHKHFHELHVGFVLTLEVPLLEK